MNRDLRVAPWMLTAVFVGWAAQAGWATPPASLSNPPASQSVPLAADLPGPELGKPLPASSPDASESPWESPPPAASPLKIVEPANDRSDQVEQVARQADEQTRHGFELASRGACFAARSEFIGALRLVAEGLDTQQKTDMHGRALATALTAMKEAEDFLPNGSRLEADLDLPGIIAAHATPVLKTDAGRVTSMTALKCYFTFAQEQLATAAGREVAGSMALQALGKLHNSLAHKKNNLVAAAEPKAMVFYQAALLVYPQNYMAANDLGVLLAQNGNAVAARTMLEHSLALSRHSTTCQNLAVVYGQMGQPALAARASQQAAMLQQAELEQRKRSLGTTSVVVQWLDPQTFAQTSTNTPNSPGTNPRAPAQQPNAPAQPSRVPPMAHMFGNSESKSTETVAPMGVATPAGPRHADAASARVASSTPAERHPILLCQALGPAAPYDICGIDCFEDACRRRGWEAARIIDWQAYAQGEYVGHARLAHVPEYRLRVDDQLDMTYRLTREETPTPYRLNVGDEIQVESFTDPEINRNLLIQPDGTITLRLLGQVHATGRTVTQLRDALDDLYKKYYKIPSITVTPLRVNTKLEDLRATIDRRAGIGGQSQAVRITPEGTVALPGIGSVQAQGLTLPELQIEVNECYRQIVEGIQVIPILAQRAPRFVYVLGEVNNPGRFELPGPTTALQSIALAGSWRVGANLRQIVVFRRGDDWRLLATQIDLQAALLGHQACPRGEIWIDDSDVIIVPKSAILVADDFINLVFTRGIYGVFPMTAQLNFAKLSSL
jgi:polysaccharide export outer membrane protein